jgi:Dolichyl-phosphate-mannose-protein mannosyltransferase
LSDARARRREALADVGTIVALSALPLLALRPLQNAPFVDDWAYAWAVEHLLGTGELRILDWSVSLNPAQVLWGALFCVPFGFSFTALRLSTWVASLLGLLGLYAMLRELGASRRDTLLGVGLVGFYPVYFVLSFSFMTDVPFVAVVVWFFAALVRSVTRASAVAFCVAVLCAGLAVAIRPVGVFLSAVLIAAAWRPSMRWDWRLWRLAAAVSPVVLVLLLALARPRLTAHRADLTWIEGSWAWRMALPLPDLSALPAWLAMSLTIVIGTLGIALAPLSLGGLVRENARVALPVALPVAAVLAADFVLHRRIRAPLDPEFIWSLRELGATEALVPPLLTPAQPLAWGVGLTIAAAVLLALAVMPLVQRRPPPEALSLTWGLAAYFALTTLLWLFYDRYLLPLVVIVVALRLATVGIPRPRLALAGVGLFAVVSTAGTWDHLQYSRALWEAVDWARRAGIEARDLDGGYVVNGWLHYAHPEHAARAPNGDVDVLWVNGGGATRYRISKQVPPGARALHAVRYERILAPSGSLHVVDQAPGAR